VAAAGSALALLLGPQPAGSAQRRVGAPYAVGLRVLHLVDRSRTIRLPSGATEPRILLTYLRYPALGAPGERDRADAATATDAGPFPLIVFGHGFAVTPAPYAALLRAWARAGYVVAAPVFPLENANAPGGPNETDIVNQPQDMRFVIAQLLAASAAAGPLHGLIDPTRIAVAGHSDGGETALVTAYYSSPPDPDIRAAVILSGAQTPSNPGPFGPDPPALLATQGTADTINPPSITDAFFRIAPHPKYLLALIGAGHLPPYTSEQRELGVVERVTIAFLDRYLKGGSSERLLRAGAVRGIATLVSNP
jgi:dienelactone hydrolase